MEMYPISVDHNNPAAATTTTNPNRVNGKGDTKQQQQQSLLNRTNNDDDDEEDEYNNHNSTTQPLLSSSSSTAAAAAATTITSSSTTTPSPNSDHHRNHNHNHHQNHKIPAEDGVDNMKAIKAVLQQQQQNGNNSNHNHQQNRIVPLSSLSSCPPLSSQSGTIQQQQQQQHGNISSNNNSKKSAAMSNNYLNEDGAENVPHDRYNLVLIILIIHGIGILMPWNMFINANSYFADYKLTITHSNGTTEASVYKEYFLSYLGLAAQIPNVLFNLFNTFFHVGNGNLAFRIIGAIIIEIIVIVLTIALAIINTVDWTSGFFYLTMSSVVVLNIANGVYQNSLYGLASKLPMKYSNAVVLGSNISGTFTSVVNIVTIWASPNLRIAAIYYFVSALIVLLICFDTYLAFPINRFFRYYVLDERSSKLSSSSSLANVTSGGDVERLQNDDDDKATTSSNAAAAAVSTSKRPPYLFVIRYAWKQCLNVFLVFFVTLSVFPVIQAGVKPLNSGFFGNNIQTTASYFSAVCCFLVFNTSAMLGNIVPNYIQLPGPDRLWIPVVLRFIFIPFFLFCNFEPTLRAWPVYIESDWLFILGGILLGLSSGYYSSLCMMYAPKSVPPEHAGTAGMMAATCLVLGIFFGINFSSLMAWLVKQSVF